VRFPLPLKLVAKDIEHSESMHILLGAVDWSGDEIGVNSLQDTVQITPAKTEAVDLQIGILESVCQW
jgi:hypothetical protein